MGPPREKWRIQSRMYFFIKNFPLIINNTFRRERYVMMSYNHEETMDESFIHLH